MSTFGSWVDEHELPAFRYDASQAVLEANAWDPVIRPVTTLHWNAVGNRRLRLVPYNDGTVAVWDEAHCLRWVTGPTPSGTGTTALLVGDNTITLTADHSAAFDAPLVRTFGPTWFRVHGSTGPLRIERTILCPEGESPWLLIRVDLTLDAQAQPTPVTHLETWALRPQWRHDGEREKAAAGAETVRYDVRSHDSGITASEQDAPFGPAYTVVLETADDAPVKAEHDGAAQPTLQLLQDVELQPGTTKTLWFRFGLVESGQAPPVPADFDTSLVALTRRLPRAQAAQAEQAAREIPWHAALLSGGTCKDVVLGHHSLLQGSVYAFDAGFNGAARDPLQHALPLVYSEPDLALSVLKNTCAWGSPDGDLPYGIDASRQNLGNGLRPSDQHLWALWLAAEYAAATGDLRAFDDAVGFHPDHDAEPVSLGEHLRRLFTFFRDSIGVGENGHVRMLKADWNDCPLEDADMDLMHEKGESVLNSAMAAWVLPVYAGLCRRLGDDAQADDAVAFADRLRDAVRSSWNGKWFHRAYLPGHPPVGDEYCWLEVQPWAILCGAATPDQAKSLLAHIRDHHLKDSPLGARLIWPLRVNLPLFGSTDPAFNEIGTLTNGAVWIAINTTLIWAAAKHDTELAWDVWRRMSLAGHTAAYPNIWEGTLSGPDSYNSPEHYRAGHTWAAAEFGLAMQSFPIANMHSHAQPLLSYLRLIGVEPTSTGALAVGAGAAFSSQTFAVNEDGSGRLAATGPVTVESARGTVTGSGELSW